MSRDADGGEEGGREVGRRIGRRGARNSREGVSSDVAEHRSKAEGQKETRENAGRRNGGEQQREALLHNATVFRASCTTKA